MDRKLSDMLLELAMQGLENPRYGESEVLHPLLFLASVAWNRETMSPNYREGRYLRELARFSIDKKKLREELISEDWTVILNRMRAYKRARFPEDTRVITLCGYTPWETVRVEWMTQDEWQQQSGKTPVH
jgi:hypothetical protein